MSRRKLAEHLGNPDISAGIPEARWMRAMTFERLVHDDRFVSRLLTTTVGELGLARPTAVRRVACHVDVPTTAVALEEAHRNAVHRGDTTILTELAVPFVGMEAEPDATPVKPDFAVVAARSDTDDPESPAGSWLIMGDAKDYERVRSRIDDQRMLKGFLQVALGAESAAVWSQLPDGMLVHRWGALAVPRNAFLQPEAVVECLDDHRAEVRARAEERLSLLGPLQGTTIPEKKLKRFVHDLDAAFDPRTCATCSLFDHCRGELRASKQTSSLLIEVGVRPEHRGGLERFIETGEVPAGVADSVVAAVRATVTGRPVWTGQRRVDPVGEPGTIEVVLAKADAAALGVHGFGLRRVASDGTRTPWKVEVFHEPQSPKARTQVMKLLGQALKACMGDQEHRSPGNPGAVHVITPDSVTADVLVSIADSLAGVETSRLRWQRDVQVGREPLTFDGERAKMPPKLGDAARLAVSFLLEADRARAMSLRDPLVDLRSVLASHVVPGGPGVDAGRLDYLVEWAEATAALDHRAVSDAIAANLHTPGARLSNACSDAIHQAARGKHTKRGRGRPNPTKYDALVRAELTYKAEVVDRAVAVLADLEVSRLRPAHRALEQDAQVVWRRRYRLRASDLVRFGRTSERWRNQHVEMLDADRACADKLQALGNPQAARDMALDAGTRHVALATVVDVDPLRLEVSSRQIGAGSTIVALAIAGRPCVEDPDVTLEVFKGSFKFSRFCIGDLAADRRTSSTGALRWEPVVKPQVEQGSVLVVADARWFKTFANGHQIAVARPEVDAENAPTPDCDEHSHATDPEAHRYCCRSHDQAEADTADWLAQRRARGELNPQTWPPIIDEDQFDIAPTGLPTAADEADRAGDQPDASLTIDDLD